MKVVLNKAKARNIRFSYLIFFGLSVLNLIVVQFHTEWDFVRFGTIASSIAFGAYVFLFFLILKPLSKNFLLLTGNICFIFAKLSFVALALYFDFRDIRELILGILIIVLFWLISPRTFQILQKRYNPFDASLYGDICKS